MALEQSQYIQTELQGSKEFPHSTFTIGRKRVVVLNEMEKSSLSSPCSTPPPKRRSRRIQLEGSNWLESLPQDLLVRILCKVTHGDLKQLLLVSKFVNEATLIAKELHFAFSTPLSKPVFKKDGYLGLSYLEDSREAPNAPKQHRGAKSRINGEKLASITVALFTSSDDHWSKDGLAREM